MKKFIVLITVLLLIGCSAQDDSPENQSIIGTWKLVEEYGSYGAAGSWKSVGDGHQIVISEENIIQSDLYSCGGDYQLESDNQISIEFDCSEAKFSLDYNYKLEGDNLILSVISGCDEGCAEKFKRLR